MKRFLIIFLVCVWALPLTAKPIYGLKTGTPAPLFSVNDIDGKPVDLKAVLKQGPAVLVFYRGGWCPYCNVQLHSLEEKVWPTARQHHATLIGISVDIPREGVTTREKDKLTFALISDPEAKLLEMYRVRYHVPDALYKKYKTEYKLDIEAASEKKHHFIAVPSVYVINPAGVITYAHVNEDYKVRAPEAEILAAITKASAK